MITFVIASIGKPSLAQTLASIDAWSGDEILVVGSMGDTVDPRVRFVPRPPGGDYGHAERNFMKYMAGQRYVAHIDDDDCYVSGHRALMADAIEKTPDRPVLFRMQYPNRITLWAQKKIACGNVGTPMFLLPNVPDAFGTWGSFVGGDCQFLETSTWAAEDYVWRPEVICLLGHNA